MSLTSLLSRFARISTLLCLIALSISVDQALADDDDGEGDRETPFALAGTGWAPVLSLDPAEGIDNLFRAMARVGGPDIPCPEGEAVPLLSGAPLAPGSWACVTIRNAADVPGIWRVDFEGAFGAGYLFRAGTGETGRVVLSNPGLGRSERRATINAGRRMASLPIALAPGTATPLYVRIDTPADIHDADPLLRPETAFDATRLGRSHAFGLFLGASVVLCLFFAAFGRVLNSPPATRYAFYLAAMALAGASDEGAFNTFFMGNPTLWIAALDKILQAVQIGAHFAFMASFVADSLPGHRLARWLRQAGIAAVLGLATAAIASVVLGGVEGALAYHDLGFEIDPLIQTPFESLPLLLGALVTVGWYLALLVTAAVLRIAKVEGGTFFALGAIILLAGMLGVGLAGELVDDFDDDRPLTEYVLLLDALIFAAAVVRQAFALRDQRDAAVRLELRSAQEKVRLTEDLLATRNDRDRARDLAERHRERLALTGHDLRQPLTSLRLALADAEAASPRLGGTLRSSLEFLDSVLDTAVADARPADRPAPENETEDVPVEVLFANARRMFGAEAREKGLTLDHEPTNLVVVVRPVALIRILSNLVSNAVKYTRSGGVTLRSRRDDDGTASLEVIDTGPGLDAAEIARIRQSYVRGSTAGGIAGSGLGLASAEGLAAEMGLRLAIRSMPGKGTCVAIEGLSVRAAPAGE